MKNHLSILSAFLLLIPFGLLAERDPQEVFENIPQSAKTAVWWHWMGCNVTTEGIKKDLEWFKRTGIGSATIFGMADICTPWATKIDNSPNAGLIAFSPEWWALVRYACDEAEKLGIELGLHNCPGYTSTGGPWIPPRLAMRELVFNVTNAEKQISLKARADFPVQNGETGRFEKPDIPCRRTDLQEIAVVDGIKVQHIPMGAFTQPNQWEIFGLECDKMNKEAIEFHLDHVIADMKKYLDRHVGKTLKFVLLDSYEAGKPTWTANMREEFKQRRGYDPLPFLPILGGYKVSAAPGEDDVKRFKADYDRTIKDLFRDVLFKTMKEKLHAAGLEFACEPYQGPFDSKECSEHVDRLMTEFWFDPKIHSSAPRALGWNKWPAPGGQRRNIVEAEAFTSGPPNCMWDETLSRLKAAANLQFGRGINRMVLHTCPLQPWNETILPGKTMGRWGTHFGRTQTWAESGKGFFDFLNRSQALLQWGESRDEKLTCRNTKPVGIHITGHARVGDDGSRLYFVINNSDVAATTEIDLPTKTKTPEWFDPVTGRITPLTLVKGRIPMSFAPRGCGFLVFRKEACEVQKTRENTFLQNKRPIPATGTAFAVKGPWEVRFGDISTVMTTLTDWTKSERSEIKYFSGTAVYKTKFIYDRATSADVLKLGNCHSQIAKVILNGKHLETLWCEPYEILLPDNAVKRGENILVVEFTNVWANRLIGDEQEAPDCEFSAAPYPGGTYLTKFPGWFKEGISTRPSKGRKCFTDWNYFTKDSPLVPSGLVGPVEITSGL